LVLLCPPPPQVTRNRTRLDQFPLVRHIFRFGNVAALRKHRRFHDDTNSPRPRVSVRRRGYVVPLDLQILKMSLSLDGPLEFDDLESWARRPGDVRSNDLWGDGNEENGGSDRLEASPMRIIDGVRRCVARCSTLGNRVLYLRISVCLLAVLWLAGCGTGSREPGPFPLWEPGELESMSLLHEHSGIRVYFGTRGETEDLGPWSEHSKHFVGRFPTEVEAGYNQYSVTFGVAAWNGSVEPWVTGPEQSSAPLDFSGGSDAFIWYGRLVGFSPDNQSVAGDVSLIVYAPHVDGRRSALRFSRLESWFGPPSELGSGEPWREGGLDYGITVSGNAFVQIDGDDGVVEGGFLGPDHLGMGGVLKRDDLTAAFGGRLSAALLID